MNRSSDNYRKLLAILISVIVGAALVKILSVSDGQTSEVIRSRCIDRSVLAQDDEAHTNVRNNVKMSIDDREDEESGFIDNDHYADTSAVQIDELDINELAQTQGNLQYIECEDQIVHNEVIDSGLDQTTALKIVNENQIEEVSVQQDLPSEAAPNEAVYEAQPSNTINTSSQYPTKMTSYSSSVATCFPHFIFQATAFYTVADKSFNNCHKKSSLSNYIFNQDVTFQDILLISSLSAQNKVRVDNVPARAPDRGNTPIGPNILGAAPWGGFSSDQYIRLLSGTQLRINSQQKEAGIAFFWYL